MDRYTVVISLDPESGWHTVICPSMPGAVTEGQTREAALDAMRGVMDAWIELASENGHGPLPETPELIARVVGETFEDRAEEGWDLAIETATLAPAASVAA
jgi:predicted RNase H-like HicB family nuclease